MAQRITVAELENMARILSRELGFSNREIEESEPGTIHLSGAYGGVKFVQMHESGGQSDFLKTGFVPKRDLHRAGSAALEGMAAMRRALTPVAAHVSPNCMAAWRRAVANGDTFTGLNEYALRECGKES